MRLLDFPELRQTSNWDCGACALQSVLIYYGLDINESKIVKESGATKGGIKISEIKDYAKKLGFKAIGKKMKVENVKEYIDKNIPVIIPLQAWSKEEKVDWENNWDNGHYVIAIGYDRTKIFFEDPFLSKRDYLTYKEFEKRWHDKSRDGKKYINYGIVIYGKKPKYTPEKAIKME